MKGRALDPARYLAAAVIAASLVVGAAWSQPLLHGQVVHSEHLQPLSQQEEMGKIFEGTQLYKKMLACGSNPTKKFVLPSWLAGTWQRSEATELSRIEIPTGHRVQPQGAGVARVVDKFGTYRDRLGLIWQVFEPAQALGKIDRGQWIDYHVVSGYDLMSFGQASVIVEVNAYHAVVDKKSGKLISAYQDEELNTYTMTGDNALKTDSSVKTFDVKGKPLYLTRAVSGETRIAPFSDSPGAEADAAGTK
jgi:hypothetical protein